MIYYKKNLKPFARHLRKKLTQAESLMWRHLRKKQLCNTLFTRQKPIGPYIVDFYAHSAKLVIEIDGSQHYDKAGMEADERRDSYLAQYGLKVMRFNNLEVLYNTDTVLNVVACQIEGRPYSYEHGKFVEIY